MLWSIVSNARGGHSHWKEVWGCAVVMTPFFHAIRRSLAYQFTVNVPILWLPFSSFRKNFHFQPCFGQTSSYSRPNFFQIFVPETPFFKENPLPRPYILKPAWHTSTKKKVKCPPRDQTQQIGITIIREEQIYLHLAKTWYHIFLFYFILFYFISFHFILFYFILFIYFLFIYFFYFYECWFSAVQWSVRWLIGAFKVV